MAKQLLGKEVTAALNEKIIGQVAQLKEKGVSPKLGIIRVGERPDDISYETGATKRCDTLGVEVEKILLPEDVSKEELLEVIDKVNKDDSIHGVLMDVYGEGILIMGESGIGKSEAALELIKRGHRLITDDVVEIHKVSDDTLVGTSPEITRHFIELRGIGIIDVKTLYGVESVRETQSIDLVIKLEEWDKDKEYDRLGLNEEYTEFLGNKVTCHSIPIRPGRNLAIIVESAAVNHRQKKMGYNAAQELYRRVQESISRNKK